MGPSPRPLTAVRPGVCVRVAARIDADPTSVSLLLAGPSALELWPGVVRVGAAGGLALVETELPSARRTAATVRALPPQRTPTAFVSRFSWSGPDLPGTAGRLLLSYAPGDATPSTQAVLELDSDGPVGELDAAALTRLAEGFLANLRAAAEGRSRAA